MRRLVLTAVIAASPAYAQAPESTFLNGYFQQVPANRPGGPAVIGSNGAPFGSAAVNDINAPNATGATQVLGPDGSVQMRVNLIPGNTFPIEYPTPIAGISGAGGTWACLSTASANVGCNFVSQGNGGQVFANYYGKFAEFITPAGVISSHYTYTPGTLTGTYPNTNIVSEIAEQGAASAGWQFNSAGQGFAFGNLGKAIGAYSVALGNFPISFGTGALVSGNFAYDFSGYGVRCHESAATTSSGPNGSNELCEQTLQVKITDALTTHRMTVDGSTGVTNTVSVPFQPTSHGTFKLDVECTNMTTGDSAVWFVQGGFTNVVSALRLPFTAGTGAPMSGSGGLSTMTLAVVPDVANQNLSIIPSPPSGNTATLNCTAIARWMQRNA